MRIVPLRNAKFVDSIVENVLLQIIVPSVKLNLIYFYIRISVLSVKSISFLKELMGPAV